MEKSKEKSVDALRKLSDCSASASINVGDSGGRDGQLEAEAGPINDLKPDDLLAVPESGLVREKRWSLGKWRDWGRPYENVWSCMSVG